MSSKQHLVLYIGHPFDLAFFLRLIPLINTEKRFFVTAIVARGNFFRDMDRLGDILTDIADNKILIPMDKIPGYGKNLFRGMKNTLYVKRLIRGLDKRRSVLISVDKSQFIANYLNSHFNKTILIQTENTLDLGEDYKPAYLRILWYNLVNILSGSNLVWLMHNRRSSGHMWHYTVLNSRAIEFYITDNKTVGNRISLPEVCSGKKSGKVLIFGNRFNDWKFISGKREEIRKRIFEFYRNLKDSFCGHTFYYKPHPRERGSEYAEIDSIFNGRLIDVGINLNAELFLVENDDIEYCFSLGSTSSRSAYEMGFSSKVFYKRLGFEPAIKKVFDEIFHEMPKGFWVEDINEINRPLRKQTTDKYVAKIMGTLNELSCM